MMYHHGYMASIKQNYQHFNHIGLVVLAFTTDKKVRGSIHTLGEIFFL